MDSRSPNAKPYIHADFMKTWRSMERLVELGLTPGPGFRPILDACAEAQLDGAFTDEASGRKWLEEHLPALRARIGSAL